MTGRPSLIGNLCTGHPCSQTKSGKRASLPILFERSRAAVHRLYSGNGQIINWTTRRRRKNTVHLYFVCKADRLILRFQYQNTNRGWWLHWWLHWVTSLVDLKISKKKSVMFWKFLAWNKWTYRFQGLNLQRLLYRFLFSWLTALQAATK